MRPYGGRVLRLAVPFRALAQRFALPLLIAAAIGLLILGKARPGLVEHLRAAVSDVAAPVLDVLSRPGTSIEAAIDEARALVALKQENVRLKAENAKLVHWQLVARRLEHENQGLRALLDAVPDPHASYVTARVITDVGSPFVRTVLINAGRRQGVVAGQPVVAAEGLVGRVVEAGQSSARVLLLTDLNSRVPGVVETSRVRGIVAGDNSRWPRLVFVPPEAVVRPGERLVTSGRGGVFPPGLPIGTVAGVGEDGIRLQPFVDWDRLEFVSVLDYALPGLLPRTRRAGEAGPLP